MIGCIIQARMGSSRLPGKVLKKIQNRPILDYVVKQVGFAKKIEDIVIATTTDQNDDVIVDFCTKHDISHFRGKEKDVLDRYYECAKKFGFQIIVRITSDNPLIDPEIIDKCVDEYEKNNCDYLSTEHPPTFPQGYAVEVFSFKVLENAWKNASKPSEREHVTPYFYNNPEFFSLKNFQYEKNLSNIRCTLDRENDLVFIEKIISCIQKQPILLTDLLATISKDPKLLDINKDNVYNEGYLKSLEEDIEFLKNK